MGGCCDNHSSLTHVHYSPVHHIHTRTKTQQLPPQNTTQLLATEKTKLTINARELVVAELDGVVHDLEQKLEVVQNSTRGQLESVQRALRSMTQERDYWKKRGQQLEQDMHTLRLAVQVRVGGGGDVLCGMMWGCTCEFMEGSHHIQPFFITIKQLAQHTTCCPQHHHQPSPYHITQMDADARTATEQGPAAAVAMKTVAAFFGDSKAKAAAAAINAPPKVQGGRTATPPSPKGRMQNALPQRRLWEIFAKGSNTEEEPLAMQDLPEGQFHDAEEEEEVGDGGKQGKGGKKKSSSSKGRWFVGGVVGGGGE